METRYWCVYLSALWLKVNINIRRYHLISFYSVFIDITKNKNSHSGRLVWIRQIWKYGGIPKTI